MQIGFKALRSAPTRRPSRTTRSPTKTTWAFTIVAALALAIGMFFVVPVALTSLIKGWLGSSVLFWLVEGLLRTTIFLGYLTVLCKQRDLRRLFQYHGAEHQVIS